MWPPHKVGLEQELPGGVRPAGRLHGDGGDSVAPTHMQDQQENSGEKQTPV